MTAGRLCALSAVAVWLTGVAIAAPAAVDRLETAERPYDLVVVEATPGGIAMAVRAAREGLNVLLVNHNDHLGGILSSGLGVWDTLYEGKRAPIYDEVRQAIFNHYRTTYGADSPQYAQALPGRGGHTNGKFEPRVAEMVFTRLVEREAKITVLKSYVPAAVERDGALMRSVTFRQTRGDKTVRVSARVFADGSYEGDLAALAKAPYRVGREPRDEYSEPHAGTVHMRPSANASTPAAAEMAAAHDKLKLRKFSGFQEIVAHEGSGAGDAKVQAFNYRTILSSDPENRIPVEKPADYDPAAYKRLEYTSVVQPIPNRKIGWNRPQLVGPHNAYVEGVAAARQQALDAHWRATLGLLYYLQNDPAVPAERRKHWQQYGLAKDEFTDNGHRPYEFYVREARRIVGRYVFTEHDARPAPGLHRAPVHADSIGVTEWYLDSHACTASKLPGTLDEGKMMLHHETFPGQVSYRCLLPKGLDNLLVPVCLSATHVAWGTVRLEPTWMNIGESAGYAAAQAVKRQQTPAQIDSDALLRTLAKNRVMIAFFNDIELDAEDMRVAGIQYFGAKGFFAAYDARPNDPLDEATAQAWAKGFAQLCAGKLDAQALARTLPAEEKPLGQPVSAAKFAGLLDATSAAAFQDFVSLLGPTPSRGDICRVLFVLVEERKK